MAVEFGVQSNLQSRNTEFDIQVPEDYARKVLTSRMIKVTRGINSPIHFSNPPTPLILLGSDSVGELTTGFYIETLDRERLQQVNLEVMGKFGFDPDVSELKMESKDDTGFMIESRDYPSQTINGLVFRRMYSEKDGQPILLSWIAVDQAPKINPKLTRLIPGIGKKV